MKRYRNTWSVQDLVELAVVNIHGSFLQAAKKKVHANNVHS